LDATDSGQQWYIRGAKASREPDNIDLVWCGGGDPGEPGVTATLLTESLTAARELNCAHSALTWTVVNSWSLSFDMVDHQDVDRAFAGFQPKPELFLKGGREGWALRAVRG
jgi:hypothetical protein